MYYCSIALDETHSIRKLIVELSSYLYGIDCIILKTNEKTNVYEEITFCSRKYMKKCVEILS